MKSPRISIITPSFNQGHFLEKTIQSVISQKYDEFEYILIDGGSTDNSVEIIKKYEKNISFWESKQDNGQSHAINKGWQRATGDIIAWINSDDYYLTGAFDKVAEAFQRNPDAIAYIGLCVLVDAEGNNIGKEIKPIPFEFEEILCGGEIPGQPAVFLSRELLDSVGYLDEDLHYIMDWEYWLRIASEYSSDKCVLINEHLAAFNTWDGGKTQSNLGKDLVEMRKFYDIFYLKTENKKYRGYKNLSFGSIYWKQGRRYFENKKYLLTLKSYFRAFFYNPIKFNFLKAFYLNLDLLLPKKFQQFIKKYFKKQKK